MCNVILWGKWRMIETCNWLAEWKFCNQLDCKMQGARNSDWIYGPHRTIFSTWLTASRGRKKNYNRDKLQHNFQKYRALGIRSNSKRLVHKIIYKLAWHLRTIMKCSKKMWPTEWPQIEINYSQSLATTSYNQRANVLWFWIYFSLHIILVFALCSMSKRF